MATGKQLEPSTRTSITAPEPRPGHHQGQHQDQGQRQGHGARDFSAESRRSPTVLLIKLALFATALLSCTWLSAEDARKQPTREVIFWIRGTTPAERSLDAGIAPVLRSFVKRGCTYPKMRGEIESRSIIDMMRSFHKSLGPLGHELIRGAETSGTAIADLVAQLGSAPKRSREEEEAIGRLKKKGDTDSSNRYSEDLERKLQGILEDKPLYEKDRQGGTSTRTVSMADRLSAALLDRHKKAAFYLIVDPKSEGSSVSRNEELARAARAVFALPSKTGASKTGGKSPERILILLLLSEGEQPSLVAIGHSVKKARVFKTAVAASDVTAGLRHLLGLPASPRDVGNANWAKDILIEWTFREEDSAAESSGGKKR